MADYTLPADVKRIFEKFEKEKFQIYVVGGAVRDLLMGKKIKDWDFTTDAKPEEILKVVPEGFYDNKFGTVGIPAKTTSEESMPTSEVYEITTMRREGNYKDHRHPEDVSWTDKIEEDLARRDFTINAIALTINNGPASPAKRDEQLTMDKKSQISNVKCQMNLVDPFNGKEDISKKIIRCVGDPNTRFQEDALRLMRAIRFAVELNFEIEEKTFLAIKNNAHLIKEIASERIRDELFKILSSMYPYIGIIKLREAGILKYILPELEKCFGIIQQGPKHDRVYDIGEHSLLSLKNTPSSDPLVRLATLLHDVGKVQTVNIQDDGNVTFYNHDFVGGKIVLQIGKRFNLSNKQIDKLYRLVRWHMFTLDENQTDSAIRRFIKNIGVENIDDMMAVRIGDRLGGGTQNAVSWRMKRYQERIKEVLHKPFSIADLKINGKDVMEKLNLKPGPKVGEILQKLFEEVLEDSSTNNREHLLNRTKELN